MLTYLANYYYYYCCCFSCYYQYIYIYIHKTETSETLTIFHLNTIIKIKKKTFLKLDKHTASSLPSPSSKTQTHALPFLSLLYFSTFSFPKTQNWKSILPRSHPHTIRSEIERRHHPSFHVATRKDRSSPLSTNNSHRNWHIILQLNLFSPLYISIMSVSKGNQNWLGIHNLILYFD